MRVPLLGCISALFFVDAKPPGVSSRQKPARKQGLVRYMSRTGEPTNTNDSDRDVEPSTEQDADLRDEPQDAELQEGLDYYLENGLFVFTAAFLRKRGYCCESGCRHCPYQNQER